MALAPEERRQRKPQITRVSKGFYRNHTLGALSPCSAIPHAGELQLTLSPLRGKEPLELSQTFTISNRRRTSFSDSPLYLEVRVDEETLKNVVLHSVATALARRVFPVPGGPTINTPCWEYSSVSKVFIYHFSNS